jgi:hypothetical protein
VTTVADRLVTVRTVVGVRSKRHASRDPGSIPTARVTARRTSGEITIMISE